MADDSLTEALGGFIKGVLVHTGYGMTIGRVLATSLQLERAIDNIAPLAVARTEPAVQELFADHIWRRLPDEQKRKTLRRMLAVHDVDDDLADAICRAIRDVAALRNAMAHGTLDFEGTDGWTFTTYWKGLANTEAYSDDALEAVIAQGSLAAQRLDELRQLWDPCPPTKEHSGCLRRQES